LITGNFAGGAIAVFDLTTFFGCKADRALFAVGAMIDARCPMLLLRCTLKAPGYKTKRKRK
jgi:hypothetical protein